MVIAFTRTIILYVLIIVGVRLMGKRQVGELEPSELVLSLLLADLAAVPMQDFGIPLLTGVIPILTLLSLTMAVSVLTMKSIRVRKLVCGQPSIVVKNGVPDQLQMRKNRFTVDELLEDLRMNGFTDLKQVRYAILETNGQLSVIPYAKYQPATCLQLDVTSRDAGLSTVLISDGRLMEENLAACGYENRWLQQQFSRFGVTSCDQVFLMTVDELGAVTLCPKEENA